MTSPRIQSLSRPFLFLGGSAVAAAALYAPGVFAEELVKTPAQTEGPFYYSRQNCRSIRTTNPLDHQR